MLPFLVFSGDFVLYFNSHKLNEFFIILVAAVVLLACLPFFKALFLAWAATPFTLLYTALTLHLATPRHTTKVFF
jgi:hypothetical protein